VRGGKGDKKENIIMRFLVNKSDSCEWYAASDGDDRMYVAFLSSDCDIILLQGCLGRQPRMDDTYESLSSRIPAGVLCAISPRTTRVGLLRFCLQTKHDSWAFTRTFKAYSCIDSCGRMSSSQSNEPP